MSDSSTSTGGRLADSDIRKRRPCAVAMEPNPEPHRTLGRHIGRADQVGWLTRRGDAAVTLASGGNLSLVHHVRSLVRA